jgi:hypothetical protein
MAQVQATDEQTRVQIARKEHEGQIAQHNRAKEEAEPASSRAEAGVREIQPAACASAAYRDPHHRTSGVALVRQDEATAQALRAGQQVDATAKQQMLDHARLLTRIDQTITSATRVFTEVANHFDRLDQAVKALEAKLANAQN